MAPASPPLVYLFDHERMQLGHLSAVKTPHVAVRMTNCCSLLVLQHDVAERHDKVTIGDHPVDCEVGWRAVSVRHPSADAILAFDGHVPFECPRCVFGAELQEPFVVTFEDR